MERLTIEFRNAEDKSTLQRVIKALEMDVVLSDADEKSSVPESHYKKIEEDFQAHLSGENKSFSFEEMESELRKKYD